MPFKVRNMKARHFLACGVAAMLCFVAVELWPIAYLPLGRVLTGRNIDLAGEVCFREVEVIDGITARTGRSAWVYHLSEADAAALRSDRNALNDYPMWSAGAFFDGDRQFHWTNLAELQEGPHKAVVRAALNTQQLICGRDQIASYADAHCLAATLLQKPTTLISGDYTARETTVTNYCLYVLDLERRVVIKLFLLT